MLNLFINRPMVCGVLGSARTYALLTVFIFVFFSYISNKGFLVFLEINMKNYYCYQWCFLCIFLSSKITRQSSVFG